MRNDINMKKCDFFREKDVYFTFKKKNYEDGIKIFDHISTITHLKHHLFGK